MFFELRNPSGTLATDLQINGTLRETPGTKSKQRMCVIAISDALFNVGYDSSGNSETPVMTQVQPLV